MKKRSGKKVASAASHIMELAKNGGPLLHHAEQLKAEFGPMEINTEFLERLDKIFRPYIDAAESVAASVLSQVEK